MSDSLPPEMVAAAYAPFDPDPVLGRYVAHHPSQRLLLLIAGGSVYALAVLILQILTARLDTQTAGIILVPAYALIALPIAWGVLHLWNREVVLYEQGFSYREGSRVRPFLYAQIATFQQRVVRIALFNRWPLTLYRCTLITDEDETLLINNLYANVEGLVRRLEAAHTRARLPIVAARLQAGEQISFGPLALSGAALHMGDQTLAWAAFEGYQFARSQLVLLRGDQQVWATLPVTDIDNLLLLVALLKAYTERRTPAPRNGTHG